MNGSFWIHRNTRHRISAVCFYLPEREPLKMPSICLKGHGPGASSLFSSLSVSCRDTTHDLRHNLFEFPLASWPPQEDRGYHLRLYSLGTCPYHSMTQIWPSTGIKLCLQPIQTMTPLDSLDLCSSSGVNCMACLSLQIHLQLP